MPKRWLVLTSLFFVRAFMAFQFQTVGALGPLVRSEFGVGLSDLGILIGLYLSPGVALALPSGALSRRFGDKACVLAGLGLMTVGGLVMALAPGWTAQIFGRLLAGFGGVVLNVMLTKMVADWFSGREMATALGLFVNSWPFGIAVALMALPPIGAAIGVRGAYLVAAGGTALGALLVSFYSAPAAPAGPRPISHGAPAGRALVAVVAAGLVWGFFNGAVSMVFSFGNSILVERGWTLAAAGNATSLALWGIVAATPIGGVIADRTGRRGAMIVLGCLGFAAALQIALRTDRAALAFAAIGLIAGVPVGAIMSLPTRALSPATRALGMGAFWTMFYLIVVTAPLIGGRLAAAVGRAGAVFDLAVADLALAVCALAVFATAQRDMAANERPRRSP